MLNIAGPEYDLGNVVFVVLEECEHRRRGFDDDELEEQLLVTSRAKLAKIKASYEEFGASPGYWQALEKEVLETALPQYIDAARELNALERSKYGVWRGGDPAARFAFALGGLVVGSLLVALPFIPIFEAMFAFALTAVGFFYPELKRFTHERRHVKVLNRLVADAAAYQQNAKLHYMTTNDIRESFALNAPTLPSERNDSEKIAE